MKLLRGLFLSAIVMAPFAARAGEVPQSALASSLGQDPSLLDSWGLVFLFPQAAVRDDSTALAVGRSVRRSALAATTSGSEHSVGAILRRHRWAGFALARVIDTLDPYPYVRSAEPQFGAAARWRGGRFGAALRGSRDKRESGELSRYRTDRNLTGNRNIHNVWAGSFGVGAGIAGMQLDGVLEIVHDEVLVSAAYFGFSDTLAVRLLSEDTSPAGAVRLAVPLGSARLVLVGRYTRNDFVLEGVQYDGIDIDAVRYASNREEWLVAASATFATRRIDRVTIAASYERRFEPSVAQNSSTLEFRERQAKAGRVGVAASQELVTGLWLHASVAKTYVEDTDSYVRLSNVQENRRATIVEHLDDAFAFGASYSWRNLDLDASMRTPLDLTRPFLLLDVHMGL